MFSISNLFVISLAFISTKCGVSVHNPCYCYSEDPVRTWTGLGGMHSPYEPVRGQFINANVSTCHPSKFWMSSRHGSRFPYESELQNVLQVIPALQRQVLTNYNEGRTSLCASDFELIRNWRINPNMSVIDLLALQCKYDQTWNLNYTTLSIFCAVFSTANAEIIEYYQDLYWYYRTGYDMLRFIQSNDPSDHKARLFNGHISIVLLLLHFDAFDDDDVLTRHNFAQQSMRIWRSNVLLPMAANFVVVKYECDDDGDNDILFLFHEIPLQIRGCDSNGVCKQSLILERLGRYLNVNCEEVYCTNS